MKQKNKEDFLECYWVLWMVNMLLGKGIVRASYRAKGK